MRPASVRAAGRGDADAVHAVVADAHLPVYGEVRLTAGMLANMLEIGDGVIAESAGAVLGAAVIGGADARLWVLHSHRRQGIGRMLLEEIERRATRGVVQFGAVTLEPAAAPFLTASGYRRVDEYWLMGIALTGEEPPAEWPEGVQVRPFRETDAIAVKQLVDDAYLDGEPDYVPLSFEDWRTFMLGDPSYDPALWSLALDGDDVVGAALTWREGYVKDLVVSPRRRHEGIGKALMLHTFAAFRERGLSRVSLKTDATNPSQAWRLYERVGMTIEETYEVYEKRV